MRTVKLIFIFILCVGNVVLLLNISDVFGSKQYPSNELSETDKEALFAEMLKDTIKKNEFYDGKEVKQIVEKYNKLKQSVQPETAKETPPAPQDTVKEKVAAEVGGSKNAEVGGSKNKVDEVVVATADDVAAKAAEDAFKKNKEQKAQTVDQIKAEILELVKKKDFNACQAHPGWNKLAQTDKNTVDYLLRTAQYKKGKAYYDGKVAKKYTQTQEKTIMNYIDGLNFEDFKTWADLEAAKNEIRRRRTETEL